MTTITFDITLFRTQFPAFSDAGTYPDSTLQTAWDIATCYISDCDYGRLNGNCRQRALNLMTAHLLYLDDQAKAGTLPGFITSSTIGDVSIAQMPVPASDQFEYFLASSPYGLQLSALLSMSSVGGFIVGGLPETGSFRKVRGIF